MKLAIPKERRPGERRVAASPETARKLKALGFDVAVEAGAGVGASFMDAAYEEAGAAVVADPATLLGDADVTLKVRAPLTAGEGEVDELAAMKRGAALIGLLAPYGDAARIAAYAERGIDAYAIELVPRITRAQSMDALSSQSNLAGYRAVVEAAAAFGRAFPMMMTAAGTIAPARVCVLGAGVAGLQAIATARRLGAVVSAFDVRRAAKEQVQSLGGSFIEVEGAENLETAGGYAKEAGEEFRRRQQDKIHETLKKQDIVICTALIPGKTAPVLVTEAMVDDMKPGSVIVDLAAEQGGNCAATQAGEAIERGGVKILGWRDMPSRIAVDASALYARNLVAFLTPLVDAETGALKIDLEDEIVRATQLTRGGEIVHPQFKPEATV